MWQGQRDIVLDHLYRRCSVFGLRLVVLSSSAAAATCTTVRGQSDEDRVDTVLGDTPIAHPIVVRSGQGSGVSAAYLSGLPRVAVARAVGHHCVIVIVVVAVRPRQLSIG